MVSSPPPPPTGRGRVAAIASLFVALAAVIVWWQHALLLPLYAGLIVWLKAALQTLTPKLFLTFAKGAAAIKGRQVVTGLLTQFLVFSHRPWRRRLTALRLLVAGTALGLGRRFLESPLWFRAAVALAVLALSATSAYAFIALLIIPQPIVNWMRTRALALLHKLGVTRSLDLLWRRVAPGALRRRWRLFAKWRLGRRQVMTSRRLHRRVERRAARSPLVGRLRPGRWRAVSGGVARAGASAARSDASPAGWHDGPMDDGSIATRSDGAPVGPIALGIDVGTTGVRVAALGVDGRELGGGRTRFAELGGDPRDPNLWWEALCRALDAALASVPREAVAAVAVDGTSGTVLAIDGAGAPIGTPLMYDDAVTDGAVLARIAAHLPEGSAAGGPTSGLAKALVLLEHAPARVLHQADWVLGRLGGEFAASDANNALKSGYDPVAGSWPAWLERAGMDRTLLPEVHAPGTALGTLAADVARRFALPADARLVAGTTDGCASFLATGAAEPGEAVTALGSTLVLKVLATEPLFAPEIGLYSHRIGDVWLAGGASNTGGRVLAEHFDVATLERLSARIDPERDSGLDYYPLPAPGERFPVADPTLPPRLAPRPDDDARFLHGLLEGMARIEALGYARLAEIGAPPLRSVRTVGGGASNAVWRRLRERHVGVPFVAAASEEAAVGTARLALRGLRRAEEGRA